MHVWKQAPDPVNILLINHSWSQTSWQDANSLFCLSPSVSPDTSETQAL
jgi:hypothetical protein